MDPYAHSQRGAKFLTTYFAQQIAAHNSSERSKKNAGGVSGDERRP